MPEFQTFPDSEAMAIEVLVDANICGGRVYPSVPSDPTYPVAVVQRLGGIPADRRAIDSPRIQVDVWGNNKREARQAAADARIALHSAEGDTSEAFQGYITGCEDDTGLTWLPDPVTAKDRYTFAVILTVRAARS